MLRVLPVRGVSVQFVLLLYRGCVLSQGALGKSDGRRWRTGEVLPARREACWRVRQTSWCAGEVSLVLLVRRGSAFFALLVRWGDALGEVAPLAPRAAARRESELGKCASRSRATWRHDGARGRWYVAFVLLLRVRVRVRATGVLSCCCAC